ncbi:LytR family transcriptional regulator [Cryobacterium melibiosiphilum]|uniref:LytR family transcriptional regulator n=1 Tax=Cryobacterium melibiosiphilum TaxID=995039 RepID=A0A3A5MSQ5_9MICO|nr:LCP family protein [Cryobacterium melibiosiphilum]RJT92271.1 LytR family transcriptional regulator [Cryobacterium melibiosiphilum]
MPKTPAPIDDPNTPLDPSPATSLPTRRSRSRARRVWRVVIAGTTALVVAATVFAGVSLYNLGRDFDTQVERLVAPFPTDVPATIPAAVSPTSTPAPAPATVAQNILLLGSDTRGTNGTSIADLRGQRSDTMMLVHIPADRQNVFVMSIMRDSWLAIPGHGEAKINAAMSFGGVPLAVETVEGLLGIHVDHVAVVDFGGFAGVTDALGGVSIDNPIGFPSSKIPGYTFQQGEQVLDGTQALAFARERYAFSDGDFQRVRNQQILIKGLMKAVLTTDTIVTPGKLNDLIDALSPFLASDDGLGSAYLAGLAVELRDVRYDDVTFFTMPTNGTGTSANGQSIVNIDHDRLDLVKQGLQSDTLAPDLPALQAQG